MATSIRKYWRQIQLVVTFLVLVLLLLGTGDTWAKTESQSHVQAQAIVPDEGISQLVAEITANPSAAEESVSQLFQYLIRTGTNMNSPERVLNRFGVFEIRRLLQNGTATAEILKNLLIYQRMYIDFGLAMTGVVSEVAEISVDKEVRTLAERYLVKASIRGCRRTLTPLIDIVFPLSN